LAFGDLFTPPTNRPEEMVVSAVTAVAAGDQFNLFLMRDGSLWALGLNHNGQLGDGTTDNGNYYTNRPEQIVASSVIAVSAGSEFSLFLKNDGSLWAMGGNVYGQLGDGTYSTVAPWGTNLPEQIVASNVTAIAAANRHSLFLKSDGSLWAMGWNLYGQLGDGTYDTTNQPEQIVSSNAIAIAGADHSLFLKSDGSLWAMGDNEFGQLGDGTYNDTNQPEQIVSSGVTAIAAGGGHSLFLKNDGSLWAMGWNGEGQLGDGTLNNTNRPERILAGGVTAIAANNEHSLFLKSDGSLWGMGWNEGQLGDGTFNNTNRPEQIIAGPPGYGKNQMSVQLLYGSNVCSYFGGSAGTNYALDRSFSLSPPDWIPQATNLANVFGVASFTNTPDPTTNNFWRIRSVP